MKFSHLAIVVAGSSLLLSLQAAAQVPPFFNGGGGIFDPEISTVESGVILDAQAVVSADRKYVTMTTRFQSAQLLALREFAFQTGNNGVAPGTVGRAGVAGVAGAGAGAAGGRNAAPGNGATSSAARAANSNQHAIPRKPYPVPGKPLPANGPSVLERPGMTLVSRVRTHSDQ